VLVLASAFGFAIISANQMSFNIRTAGDRIDKNLCHADYRYSLPVCSRNDRRRRTVVPYRRHYKCSTGVGNCAGFVLILINCYEYIPIRRVSDQVLDTLVNGSNHSPGLNRVRLSTFQHCDVRFTGWIIQTVSPSTPEAGSSIAEIKRVILARLKRILRIARVQRNKLSP